MSDKLSFEMTCNAIRKLLVQFLRQIWYRHTKSSYSYAEHFSPILIALHTVFTQFWEADQTCFVIVEDLFFIFSRFALSQQPAIERLLPSICRAGSLFESWSWKKTARCHCPIPNTTNSVPFFVESLKKLVMVGWGKKCGGVSEHEHKVEPQRVRPRGPRTVFQKRVEASRGDGCMLRGEGSVLFFIHAEVFF